MEKENKIAALTLRQLAEEQLKKQQVKPSPPATKADMLKLIHELEVHQIEMELINEELMMAKNQAMAATEKYAELYDFAPSGYFTLNKEGKIVELNLHGAKMLGKERSLLINSHFGLFIKEDSQSAFTAFLEEIFQGKSHAHCDVPLVSSGKITSHIHFTGIISNNKEQCRVTSIDITNRKKAEDALRENERKFQSIIQYQSEGIGIVNKNEVFEFANLAASKIFETDNLVGTSLLDFLHPDETEKLKQQITKRQRGISESYELQILTKKGNAKNILVSAVPNTDENNKYLSAYGVFRDITDRKKAENALRESEENLNYVQQIAGMGSWELNLLNGKYSWSKNNYLLAGLQPFEKEITIEIFLKMLPPEDVILRQNKINEAIESKKRVSFDFRIITPDGTIKWIQNNIVPLIEGNKVVALRGVYFDITEKRASEEKIKQQNERLNAIIQANPDMFFVIGEDGTYLEVYTSSPEQLLLPPELIIGENLKDIFGPEAAKQHLQNIAKCIRDKKLVTYEYTETINNRTDVFEARLAPFATNQVLALVRNITDRKHFENEIRELNTNLEKRIEERTAELAESNNKLINQIEARKMIEQALDNEKRRLDDIIKGTNVGTWEWNIQTGETIFNERWAEMIGFTLDELSPVNIQTWTKFIHPDDLTLSGELLQKHLIGELEYYECEARMKHKNGSWIWVLDRGMIHTYDQNGKPLLMSGTHQDITKRRLNEEYEKELLNFSIQLTGIPNNEIPAAINKALLRIGMFLSTDRTYIFEIDNEFKTMSNTFEWCNEGIQPEIENLQNVPCNLVPMWMKTLKEQGFVLIPSVADLPELWASEKEILEPQGIKSLMVMPLNIDRKLIGFIGMDAVKEYKTFTEPEINVLKVWSNLLASLINHQRKEKIIEQTRVNYETFFNTIDDFLFVLDEQGNMIHTNTTVTRRLGYSTEELIQKNVLMVHPAERREEAGRIVGEMLAGTADFCPVPLITKSGDKIPVETRVKAGFWNDKPAIFGVTKDISAIKLSEEKFSKAFQVNSACMAISSLNEGKFLDVNNTFLETMGYQKSEVIGKTPSKLNLFDEDFDRNQIINMMEKGSTIKDIELKVKTKNGNILTGLFSIDKIYIGNETCLLTMMVDITERKRAEAELVKAKTEAEKANLAKSEFLSRMSHELRTPLNSILGFAQLLDMGELNPVHKKGVKHILKSGANLLNLINEVLDISRIEAGKFSISIEPVQVRGIISEIVDVVKQFADKQRVSIAMDGCPANEKYIMADKQRAKQVLINLINNAIKYNHEGGSVAIKTEIRPDIDKNEGNIRISITDTGPGISDENLKKIFVPFERIGADKTGIEGTGLGLSVVSKLMQAMKGSIGVESAVGKGSTFWIEFPAYQGESPTSPDQVLPAIPPENLIQKKGTILYIEDNLANFELIDQILMSHYQGIKLISTVHGTQALSIAKEYHPDLVLLDLNLPDIHGTEVLTIFQENLQTRNIPVIVISADAMPRHIESLMKAGVKGYLTKPLDLQSFLKIINTFIV